MAEEKKTTLPDTQKEEILRTIKDISQDSTVQQRLHNNAAINGEFIKGNQWVYIDTYNNIRDIPYDMNYYNKYRKHRPREVVNIIYPIWRTYKSYLIKAHPKMMARPEDPQDVGDVIGARIATKVMEYLYERLVVRKKADQIYNYQTIYCTVFLHPFYNTESKQCDLRVIPPEQLYPFPSDARDWNEVKAVVYKRALPTELLELSYPDKSFNSDAGEDTMSFPEFSASLIPSHKPALTTVMDYWELPTEQTPGCFVRASEKEVLEYVPKFPYQNQHISGEHRLPFIPIYDNKSFDSVFGFPTIGLAIKRQMAYNMGKSRLAQMREIMPKLLIDVNSKIRGNDIFDDDTTLIEYQGALSATPPMYIFPAAENNILAQDVFGMPQEIEHTTGFHDVLLRAESIGSIQSGVGLEHLSSKDEMRLSPALESLRLGLIETFEQLYALVRQYYGTKQVKEILGEMGEIDIITFKQLKMNPMTFVVEDTSFTPFSQEYRRRIALELAKIGAWDLHDPNSRRRFYEYLDPNLALSLDITSREEQLAKIENKRMLTGESVPINPDDKDDIHLDVLNVIMKDFRFRDLDEAVQGAFNVHAQAHRTQGMQKMKETMQMMQVAQGQGTAETGPTSDNSTASNTGVSGPAAGQVV